ncbi:MAG: OmpH family outer membrane protein [Selenomonadaceae bacterium]|nr:OmpH family outer membrane protein [Selenomonadaceae bacterium]
MMKKFLLIATILMTMLISGCGEVNIGYVDGEKLMDTPQLKTIRDEGEKKLQEAEEAAIAELTAKENATDEEKQQAQLETQRKLMGIQQAYASQLKQKLDAALADIVKSKNVDVVIDSSESQKIVFEGGIDLTDEVVKKLQ